MGLRLPRIRSFHGESYEALEEISGFAMAQVAFDDRGAATASLGLPETSEHLAHYNIRPGGRMVVYEFDGTDLGTTVSGEAVGLPEVWTGRATGPGGRGTVTVQVNGPRGDLERLPIRSAATLRTRGVNVARMVVQDTPEARLVMGQEHGGRAALSELAGRTAWEALADAADSRGEEFYISAIPGEARYALDWLDPLSAEDVSGDVVLLADQRGANCTWEPAYDMGAALEELSMVGLRLTGGIGKEGATLRAPGPVIGRRAALTAIMESSSARVLTGRGPVTYRPDLKSRASMEASLESALRAVLAPILMLQLDVKDPALFRHLRPGRIVRARLAREYTRLYRDGLARIRAVAFTLSPTLQCTLGVELWDPELE